MELSVIILAAGQGKRMQTDIPKVLHSIGGIPLLERVIRTAENLQAKDIYVVYGNGGSKLRDILQHANVHWIEQHQQLGTGHAVLQVLPKITDNARVLVLYGDVPLISKPTLNKLLTDIPEKALGILIAERDNPTGYGRIIRDKNHEIIAIIEQKDATPQQQKIKEINTGILTTTAKNLENWLPRVANKNSQGEYYLTDIVALAVADGCPVIGVNSYCMEETQGVNDRCELARLERYYQQQQAQYLMLQGVTLMDPLRFDLRGELMAEKDITIDINVIIEGKVSIGSGSKIGPNTLLRNVTIGNNVEIKANCVIEDAIIESACVIGPFARIRPKTHLKENVHIGNFVEIKNSEIDKNSKAQHLAYVGDATIGENVNVGAGVITCNYDGVNKYRTIIEDGAFIGSDSQLVAPVTIGEGAYIGSGSTITTDAPPGKLTLGRAKQVTIEKWRPPKKK